jgi:hypothetical protein
METLITNAARSIARPRAASNLPRLLESPKERSSFLKKEAKNFYPFRLWRFPMRSAQMNKSFLVLFFKKELLPSGYSRRQGIA